MGAVVEHAAAGQWAVLFLVAGACIAAGRCLSFLIEYRHEHEHHQRKGPYDAHA